MTRVTGDPCHLDEAEADEDEDAEDEVERMTAKEVVTKKGLTEC